MFLNKTCVRLQGSLSSPWLLKTKRDTYTILGHINFDSVQSEGDYGAFQPILN